MDNHLFDLVEKYDRPGPRYTSYPASPHFSDDFGPDDFAHQLRRQSGPLSVYVHLPFCRSLCYYCGCHMQVTHRPDRIASYLERLEAEISLVASNIDGRSPVEQVHWGGGTPTYLSPDQIVGLMAALRRDIPIATDAEISIEGDPRGLTRDHLEAARSVGFNRLSLGVQDFDAEVQQAINRVQSTEMVGEAIAEARELGFEGVSVDLIYGLPHQTAGRFLSTIEEVLRLGPDRISMFSYAHVPWKKKHQRVIDTAWLPSPREKIEIFLQATRKLTADGAYRFIGMDHFARPDDPLAHALNAGTLHRNFQGYSTKAGADLVGVGLSSISQCSSAYAQNVLDLPSYFKRIDEGELPTARGYHMTPEDVLRRDVIARIMCGLRLDVAEIEDKHGIDFWAHFAGSLPELRQLEGDGIIELLSDRIMITSVGRLFLRNVAMVFDAYLDRRGAKTPLYSRTI